MNSLFLQDSCAQYSTVIKGPQERMPTVSEPVTRYPEARSCLHMLVPAGKLDICWPTFQATCEKQAPRTSSSSQHRAREPRANRGRRGPSTHRALPI